MAATFKNLTGAGLGLKRSFLADVLQQAPEVVGFYEVAPENWMTIGGKHGQRFKTLSERFPLVAHGLSLSIGSTDPLDEEFLSNLKSFLAEYQVRLYSEHLSYCSHGGHLYDLMPIPFTEEAVKHVVARIRRVQDILEQRIAIENVSYYAAPGQEMSEIAFFNAVVTEADCLILLDINNIYVNSVNHRYDAEAFLTAIPSERIAYGHMAGHFVQAPDFLVDTHGAPVIDPVWALLAKAYQHHGVFPTLLERDFNIPPLPELIAEVATIASLQQQAFAVQPKQVA